MSTSGRDRLVQDLQNNSNLFQEFREISQDLNRLLEWSLAKGYAVTRSELMDLVDSDRELSDDELEQAAGGDWGDGTGGTPPPPGAGG